MVLIREEKPDDIPAVRMINERAFGQPQEAGMEGASGVARYRSEFDEAMQEAGGEEG